jgi:enoyl-[acyl-carrier protein] reductase/trans-2-enoyl-CoA reductase (NAD+)
LELLPAVQADVAALWDKVDTDNLDTLSDFAGYKEEFLQLFGFEVEGVDYDADVDPAVTISQMVS